MELCGGAFAIDVHHVLADGDLVVALVAVNAQRNGICRIVSGSARLAGQRMERRLSSANIRLTSRGRMGSGPNPLNICLVGGVE